MLDAAGACEVREVDVGMRSAVVVIADHFIAETVIVSADPCSTGLAVHEIDSMLCHV